MHPVARVRHDEQLHIGDALRRGSRVSHRHTVVLIPVDHQNRYIHRVELVGVVGPEAIP